MGKPGKVMTKKKVWITLAIAIAIILLLGDVPKTAATEEITYDACSGDSEQASSFSFSHTTSGLKRILFVAVVTSDPVKSVSSVTYAGDNLTYIYGASCAGNEIRAELWYLVNPPSGSNTVAVTLAGTSYYIAQAISYCNVIQIDPIDGYGSVTYHSVASGFTSTATVNVSTENAWVMAILGVRQPYYEYTVTSSDTIRLNTWSSMYPGDKHSLTSADKNGPQTTGNKSISFDVSAGGCASEIIVAFKPALIEPVVSTGTATNVSHFGGTLNGTLVDLGDYSPVELFFQWREFGADNWTNTGKTGTTTPENFSDILSDLKNHTTYEYRAVAEYDSYVYGDITTFTTRFEPTMILLCLVLCMVLDFAYLYSKVSGVTNLATGGEAIKGVLVFLIALITMWAVAYGLTTA